MRMATLAPTRKLTAATGGVGVGWALAQLIVWGLREAGADVPEGIEAAVEVLCSAGVAFLGGYFMPPSSDDIPVREAGDPFAVRRDIPRRGPTDPTEPLR